jgi:DNA-directed RNA polymerase subunit RPC12/RpoP
MITVKCPKCSGTFEVDLDAYQNITACPICGHIITIKPKPTTKKQKKEEETLEDDSIEDSQGDGLMILGDDDIMFPEEQDED